MSLKNQLQEQIKHMNRNKQNPIFETLRRSTLNDNEKKTIGTELNTLYSETTFNENTTQNENYVIDTHTQEVQTEPINNPSHMCSFLGGSTIITLILLTINNFLIYKFTDIQLRT